MYQSKKNFWPLLFLVFFAFIMYSCKRTEKKDKTGNYFVEFRGNTMGTTYHIMYLHDQELRLKDRVDSILQDFNHSLSTYQADSEISQFNNKGSFIFKSPYFYPVLKKSKEVFEATEGAFDPTVGPLVNAWGFGFKKSRLPSDKEIDSLKNLVGFKWIQFDSLQVTALKKGVQLDFSAIAKGYGIDVIADFLDRQGIQNYWVEIGGEIACKGGNRKGEDWKVGIRNPFYKKEGSKQIVRSINLKDRAIATSGNYENFYWVNGKKYVHTINPKSGYPVENELLSASVIAKNAMTADAFATAFMVLGLRRSMDIIDNNTDIYSARLIYLGENGAIVEDQIER